MDFQCVFWNGRTEKHQTSTARFRLAEENGQHRPFPSLACVLPHPLQNRVPRAAETSPSAPAKKPAETLGFCRFSFCTCCMVIVFTLVRTPDFLTQLHPPPTAATLSSTQNAPGFAFFGLFRVRFPLFCCFPAAKFLPWFLCILPHSVYKLKPSVIPCKREVSFLT